MSTAAHTLAPRLAVRADFISSGILPVDNQLDGLMRGRTYVLSGAPGTGKSIAGLQFLMAGAKAGERVAILTLDDPQDVLGQGEYLGFDIAAEVAAERLYILRFQLDFARRFARATSPDEAFAELRSLLGPEPLGRFVIDSVVPFIDAAGPSQNAAISMLQLLDELGATSIVTYPGDLAGVYDRRLDPLVQRAAAMFHLSADLQRQRHIEIRKVRYRVPSNAPIPYRIEPGAGIIPALEEVRFQQEEVNGRQRVVLELPQTGAEEALKLLQSHYNVKLMNGAARRSTPIMPLSVMPARRAIDLSEVAGAESPSVAQPTRSGARVPFDAPGFRGAIQSILAADSRSMFSIVALTTPPGELERVGDVVLRTVRAVNGDLVAVANNQVFIYLHATGRKHAPYFVQRLRDSWQNVGHGELIVDVLGYPGDQERIRTLLNSLA
ncbi:MAG TPA: RAD55 family ATPase [Gemmatimonadaceae bacterium]|nr:RAD55 family ATPase [Gemmatimonadaceae bacterium]